MEYIPEQPYALSSERDPNGIRDLLPPDRPTAHVGKGPERVIARRPAFEAVERGTVPHNYVCATPKRSATDLILSLVDEIEDSLLNKKETVTLATFDVKRAFDAV